MNFRLFLFVLLAMTQSPLSHAMSSRCIKAVAGLDSSYLETIPVDVPLPKTDRETIQISRQGSLRYELGFPKEFVLSHLQLICDEKARLDRKTLLNMIQARKSGQILRTLYRYFSSDGQVPPVFDEFLRRLGKALDRAKEERFSKVPPHARVALETVELGALDRSLHPEFEPTILNFRRNLQKSMDRIRHLATADRILRSEYHQMRKLLRDLKILYRLMSDLWNQDSAKSVTAFLEHVDDRIGETKDGLKVIEDEYGDKIDEELITRVAKSDRRVIEEFLNRLTESLQLDVQ